MCLNSSKFKAFAQPCHRNGLLEEWNAPECMPAPSRDDEDFTADKGAFQYLLVRIRGKVEELSHFLKNGTSLSCHPGGTTAGNVIVSVHQGAILFMPRCHSCDLLKQIGVCPESIFMIDIQNCGTPFDQKGS